LARRKVAVAITPRGVVWGAPAATPIDRRRYNASGKPWFQRLADAAIEQMGHRDAADWLNEPSITCDYAPVHFPGDPSPQEWAAFEYELGFAVRLADQRRGLIPT
jgi:hypothetical protein